MSRAGPPGGEHSLSPASNPNALSALSSVAMEELYALERDEAMRRAEFEVRHLEALRRAEHEARLMSYHGRLSKSATATPLSTPFFSAHFPANEDNGYFGVSRERDMPGDEDAVKHTRRRSFGASKRELLSMHPHASGHVVDGNGRHAAAHSHSHSMWSHPYHHPVAHRPHLHPGHEDSPSPISSDSDSMHPAQSPVRASQAVPAHQGPAGEQQQHAHGSRTPGGTEFAFTPSTSPFLGGLRTLNIHSSGPSRAPSPFRLPPPSMDSSSHSPVEEYGHFYDARARKISSSAAAGSPPATTGVLSGRMAKRSSAGDLVAYGAAHGVVPSVAEQFAMPPPSLSFHIPYSNDRASAASLPTPQLSSGPSSSGSSPRSRTQSIHGAADASSAASSRASSPPPVSMGRPHHHAHASSSQHHHHAPHHHHHAHLAHSVRAAFGMTPIHPRPRPPPSTASTGTDKTLSPSSAAFKKGSGGSSGAESLPASRAASPPIRLAPLKMLSSPSSPRKRPDALVADADPRRRSLDGAVGEMVGLGLREREDGAGVGAGGGKVKVELPGFSEFAAASGLGA